MQIQVEVDHEKLLYALIDEAIQQKTMLLIHGVCQSIDNPYKDWEIIIKHKRIKVDWEELIKKNKGESDG